MPDVVRIALVRFRWEIVSLKQTSKGKRLTVPTSSNWLSIRNAMMVQDADCTLPWIGEVRLQSNRRLLITRYQILENAFTLRFNAYSLKLMVTVLEEESSKSPVLIVTESV